MTDRDEINRELAEKLMGWETVLELSHPVYYSGGEFEIESQDWNPCEKITQAFECLEKFGSFDVGKYGTQWEENIHENYYCCRVLKHGGRNDNPSDSITEYGSTPALAIARACLAAITKAGEK